MNEWIKLIFGGMLVLLGAFLTWVSAVSISLAAYTFVILLILNITGLIAIGWWVLWTPLLMFFGGFLAMGINLFLTFLGVAIASDV